MVRVHRPPPIQKPDNYEDFSNKLQQQPLFKKSWKIIAAHPSVLLLLIQNDPNRKFLDISLIFLFLFLISLLGDMSYLEHNLDFLFRAYLLIKRYVLIFSFPLLSNSQDLWRENASKRNATPKSCWYFLPIIALLSSFIMRVEQIILFKGFLQLNFFEKNNMF